MTEKEQELLDYQCPKFLLEMDLSQRGNEGQRRMWA